MNRSLRSAEAREANAVSLATTAAFSTWQGAGVKCAGPPGAALLGELHEGSESCIAPGSPARGVQLLTRVTKTMAFPSHHRVSIPAWISPPWAGEGARFLPVLQGVLAHSLLSLLTLSLACRLALGLKCGPGSHPAVFGGREPSPSSFSA